MDTRGNNFVFNYYISDIPQADYKYVPILFLLLKLGERINSFVERSGADVRVRIPGEIIDFCRRRIKGQGAL